jgi:hypothetical protein
MTGWTQSTNGRKPYTDLSMDLETITAEEVAAVIGIPDAMVDDNSITARILPTSSRATGGCFLWQRPTVPTGAVRADPALAAERPSPATRQRTPAHADEPGPAPATRVLEPCRAQVDPDACGLHLRVEPGLIRIDAGSRRRQPGGIGTTTAT